MGRIEARSILHRAASASNDLVLERNARFCQAFERAKENDAEEGAWKSLQNAERLRDRTYRLLDRLCPEEEWTSDEDESIQDVEEQEMDWDDENRLKIPQGLLETGSAPAQKEKYRTER